jgi:hypothetical protein
MLIVTIGLYRGLHHTLQKKILGLASRDLQGDQFYDSILPPQKKYGLSGIAEKAAADPSNACIRNTTTELVLITGIDKSTVPHSILAEVAPVNSDRRLGRSWAQEGETACGVWGVGHLPQLLQLTIWRVVIRRLSCLPKSQFSRLGH